jgi:uronate dehydrogenase
MNRKKHPEAGEASMNAKKVLITGINGLIGNTLYSWLLKEPARYDVYGLARRREHSDRIAASHVLTVPEEKLVLSDLSDLDQLQRAFSGMETVVHLAAVPKAKQGWSSVLSSNIIGAYHAFEACKRAGVERIVFASSVMVSTGWLADEPYSFIKHGEYERIPVNMPLITPASMVHPVDLYACSKVCGESLARVYSASHGLSCICVRIGSVVDKDLPSAPNSSHVWCSKRDVARCIQYCIDAPESVVFDIFYAVSNDRWRWVDMGHAADILGFKPMDSAENALEQDP